MPTRRRVKQLAASGQSFANQPTIRTSAGSRVLRAKVEVPTAEGDLGMNLVAVFSIFGQEI
jgi:hypothetical protein